MKKIYLFVILISAVLLLQNCKKDTVIASASSTALLFAQINDTTWNPATINAAINFNSASQTKQFVCSGNTTTQQINFSVALSTNANTAGFPINTYNVNTTGNVNMAYNILSHGVFAPQGTVGVGSGSIIITAVDSVKKVITGTYSFTSIKNNYDVNGNIASSNIAIISQGAFNSLPYTFNSK